MSDADANAAAAAAQEEIPLPPATFEFFILSLKAQAELAMGLLAVGGEEDRPKPDFRIARHSIDLLAMIVDKTKGNLTYNEERLATNALTELRFRYVQAMEAQSNKQ